MTSPPLDIRATQMLMADWFSHLATASGLVFGQHGVSGSHFTLGPTDAFHVKAHLLEKAPFLSFEASDPNQQDLIDTLGAQALAEVQNGNLGGIVWYATDVSERDHVLSAHSLMGPFLQRLGTQQRIAGWRRLGSNVLLEFTEKPADQTVGPQLFAPPAVVKVYVAAPGPCAGLFSSHVAHGVLESIAAICTFALGRPTQLPFGVFPAKVEVLAELDQRRTDPAILTLARKGVGLDIFSMPAIPGGWEVFSKLRAALITFDAAVHQERDSVACILYVVAAESLTVPNTSWRHSRLTARFIDFYDELMPADLDQLVAHGNFEQVFQITRGSRTAEALRRKALDRIYGFRSGRLHEGLRSTYRGISVGQDMWEEIRRGLFADFAEAAIIRFAAAPRVSLIGIPSEDTSTPSSTGAAT